MNQLNYKKTFILGFGFFAISITWSVYNAFMPKLLSEFITSSAMIGFVMTFDNYFALFMQPAIGIYSDRVRTKWGRRMPFLMIGMPLAALFNLLIPNFSGLITLILFLVCMNISMSIFRTPVITLMPDLTQIKHRSRANSIINFMGGLGALTAYIVGSKLWTINFKLPFYLSGVLILGSFIILFLFIKEKRDVIHYEQAQEKVNVKDGLKKAAHNANVRYMLFAICAWFIGYNGIETFFTLYGERHLGVEVSEASFALAFISLSFLICALPAGIIGSRIGKKKTIRIGIVGMILCFLALTFCKTMLPVYILFIILGACWAMININSYPMLAEMAPDGYLGTYTGLYYLFSSLANIVSPPLLGSVLDGIGYKYMFGYGFMFFIIALIMLSNIKSSEKLGNVINT
ncbi:SLC45 family MFS transporter [Cellulosilyticum sp. I15G10I2]|uniref:SLC45 family MFS transporter n=1 Tax=Cellulosilyticum sp. I15G10I2 TaxID=1892843 RepID=UPI00085C0D4B|nr:SLC45 family MFS transporter [Cellulosilyticum sp. I15G10I2]